MIVRINASAESAQDALQRRIKIVVNPAEIRLFSIALCLELLDDEVDHWVCLDGLDHQRDTEQSGA